MTGMRQRGRAVPRYTPSGSQLGTTIMAFRGKVSLEEAFKGDPTHPFAKPGITFVPRQTASSRSTSPATRSGSPAPNETPLAMPAGATVLNFPSG